MYDRSRLALEECLQCKAQSVLDVGCGSGVNTILFARNGIPNVVGIDYADNMLDLARERTPLDLAQSIQYVRGDFASLELGDSYDCVVALGVFDYLESPVQFIEKMMRSCNRKIIFSVPCRGNLRQVVRRVRYVLKGCPLHFYDRRQLERMLNYKGWETKFHDIGSSGLLCVLTATSYQDPVHEGKVQL